MAIDKAMREARRREQAEGAQRLIESGALDDLFAKIDAGEVQLDGDGGFVQQLIKAGLERGLQAELTEHVGYEKGDPEARFYDNSRNGSFPKTVGTTAGNVELAIPRDRNGTFTPRLVPTGSRRLSQLDEMIVSLYAGGMTVRDIEHHLVSTLGVDLSHEAVSNITEEIAEEVLAWQNRPLEAFYPVIYLDAIVVKVRDGGHVRNKAAHIAVGVDMEGIKHVLGIWVQTAVEHLLNDLRAGADGSRVHHRRAVGCHRTRIGTMLEQQLRQVAVSAGRGQVKRRQLLLADGVHICTMRQK